MNRLFSKKAILALGCMLFLGVAASIQADPIAGVTATSPTADYGYAGNGEDKLVDGITQASGWRVSGYWTDDPFVVFNLGAVYTVDKMTVWNYGDPGADATPGVKTANVLYSADGTTWTDLGNKDFNIGHASWTSDPIVPQDFLLGNVSARYIKISINTAWSGRIFTHEHPGVDFETGNWNDTGMNEVQFFIPEVANRAPVANSQSVTLAVNTPKAVTLTASDPDGNPITYQVNNPAHGSLSGTAPSLTYTPGSGYSGPDSFTFQVTDGSLTSSVATVSLAVVANIIGVTASSVSDAVCYYWEGKVSSKTVDGDIDTFMDIIGGATDDPNIVFDLHGTYTLNQIRVAALEGWGMKEFNLLTSTNGGVTYVDQGVKTLAQWGSDFKTIDLAPISANVVKFSINAGWWGNSVYSHEHPGVNFDTRPVNQYLDLVVNEVQFYAAPAAPAPTGTVIMIR